MDTYVSLRGIFTHGGHTEHIEAPSTETVEGWGYEPAAKADGGTAGR